MTWAILHGGITANGHHLAPHQCPPQLVAAVLRDVEQRHGLRSGPLVSVRGGPAAVDFGGAIFTREWDSAPVYPLGDGKRSIEVMRHHRIELLYQLRERLAEEPRQAGARWPWLKLHTWPGVCTVLYLSEAKRLEAELAAEVEP